MGNFNKLSFPCLIICRIKLQEDAKVHFQKLKASEYNETLLTDLAYHE